MLFVSQYLDELVAPEEAAVLRPTLNLFKRHAGLRLPAQVASYLSAFTPEQRRLFFELQAVDTPEMRRLYLGVLDRHRSEIAELSPASVLPTLKTPLYVLHGSNDIAIPAGEVAWMQKESENNPDAHFLISPWLGHAEVGRPTSLASKLRIGIFFTRILRRALNTG